MLCGFWRFSVPGLMLVIVTAISLVPGNAKASASEERQTDVISQPLQIEGDIGRIFGPAVAAPTVIDLQGQTRVYIPESAEKIVVEKQKYDMNSFGKEIRGHYTYNFVFYSIFVLLGLVVVVK